MRQISALTWNVWFGGHRFEERCTALVEEIGRADADLIALQEVTPEFLVPLTAAPWAKAYELSDPEGETLGDYGVLILSRLPMTRIQVRPLPTRMGRSLVLVDVNVDEAPLTFATVHLESQEDADLRARQLADLFTVLARRPTDALLVGDFNFVEGAEPESSALDPAFADVWSTLHPGDPGYTVDSEINRMRYSVKEKVTRKRIDRVLVRGRLSPAAIELVGARPVADHDTLFPSDHFGLKALS